MILGFRMRWAIGLVMALFMVGCTAGVTKPSASDGAVAESQESATEVVAPPSSSAPEGFAQLEGTATVELVVNGERIVVEVDGSQAPLTAGNFVDLVQRGVYDGTVFHRVVREPQPFVVQGGDPQSTDPAVPVQRLGTGGFVDPDTQQKRVIPLEITPAGADQPIYSQTFEMAGQTAKPALQHTHGALAMARSQFPDSASSQFYFALADLPFLDGSYAVFGYVTEGLDVVDAIQQGDVLESAVVVEGLDNLATE
ncbi:peptidylprolyl isomerase [Leptothoe kymatousa]|uniref:Peptidyl-prolyl cis-trans isomerase n=1 Tax=Leptothoe kymatousa TAU-MAC 1615 TaxID=2364775 RepID=A0ABS5Y123_9CYAN|nr:peptidylprolyl isomerase [Leptothoe kymatousa]MBT9311532.1 peptidylprolyl isomerase [Leptothoe kymatousa TAU-MAC 1615]